MYQFIIRNLQTNSFRIDLQKMGQHREGQIVNAKLCDCHIALGY